VGLYNNNSSSDSYPTGKIADSGDLLVDNTVHAGVIRAPITAVNLTADKRYWAAIVSNSNIVQVRISGLASDDVIFWGLTDSFERLTGVQASVQQYGLPMTFPTVDPATDLNTGSMPAIGLGFASVT
jgi:hypothetical protein